MLFHETAINRSIYLSSKENVQLCAVYLEKKKKEPVGKERAPYVKRKEEGG